jgi:hypothetical protein
MQKGRRNSGLFSLVVALDKPSPANNFMAGNPKPLPLAVGNTARRYLDA